MFLSRMGEKEGSFTLRKGADDAMKLIVVKASGQKSVSITCRNERLA